MYTKTPAHQRYRTLSLEELAGALRQLPCWRSDGSRLQRTVRPADLWQLLEPVGAVENELDHHSVVDLDTGAVTFSVWTHVRDAVTAADVELAQRIDAVVASLPQPC